MTNKSSSSDNQPDPEAALRQMNEVAMQSQRALQAFWERQAEESASGGFSMVDAGSISNAFSDWSHKLMKDPAKLVESQFEYKP